MPAQIFGAEAAVISLHLALNGAVPSSTVFQSHLEDARSTTESIQAFATEFAKSSASSLTDEALAAKLIGNLGLMRNDELLVQLRDHLALAGPEGRGIVVLQLTQILSDLEQAQGDLAIYAAPAMAWNNKVTGGFEYLANLPPIGVGPVTPNLNPSFNLTINQDRLEGTGLNDRFVAGAAQDASGQLLDTLQSGDVVDGGAGIDILSVTRVQPGTLTPSITNVEILRFRQIQGGGAIDLKNVAGLETLVFEDGVGSESPQATNVGHLKTLEVNHQMLGFALDGLAADASTLSLRATSTGKAGQLARIDLGLTKASPVQTLQVRLENSHLDLDSTHDDAIGTITIAASGVSTLLLSDSRSCLVRIEVSGTGALRFENSGALAFKQVATVDASANAGGVRIDFSDQQAPVNFHGGSGADQYVASNMGDTVAAGVGSDLVFLGDSVATPGARRDTVVLTRVEDSRPGGHDRYFNFDVVGAAGQAGTSDQIDVSAFGFEGAQKQTINATHRAALASDLSQIQNLFFVPGGAAGVAYAQVGFDTYVLIDADKNGHFSVNADLLIELIGTQLPLTAESVRF